MHKSTPHLLITTLKTTVYPLNRTEYRKSMTTPFLSVITELTEVIPMIFHLRIDKSCEESVTAVVQKRTALINEIERLVMQENITEQIAGYCEDEITMLELEQIECFFIEKEKTYAIYSNGRRYLIKKRLYELEQILPNYFEKINKSAIANWKKITKFKVQLSGAVDAVFESGYTDCISRRCFAQLRKRYGL